MVRNEIPLELRNLHPYTVNLCAGEYRAAGHSEDGLSSTLRAIKVFANAFVFKHAELTLGDPLRKVPQIVPPERDMPVFDEQELRQILDSFDQVTYEGIRDRAFVFVLASTGVRNSEAAGLTLDDYDPVSGELHVQGKGDRERFVTLSAAAHRSLKAYLRLRRRGSSLDLWLSKEGQSLSASAWTSMFRRHKKRCGVPRVRAHLFRHTFGSYAIEKGAERAAVQDMLGHETDQMTKRYTRQARKRTAAEMMPRFSPV
jgi:integrase/recombinase XerD